MASVALAAGKALFSKTLFALQSPCPNSTPARPDSVTFFAEQAAKPAVRSPVERRAKMEFFNALG